MEMKNIKITDWCGKHGVEINGGFYFIETEALPDVIWSDYVKNGDSGKALRRITDSKKKISGLLAVLCSPEEEEFPGASEEDTARVTSLIDELNRIQEEVNRIAYPEQYSRQVEALKADLQTAEQLIEELRYQKEPPKIDLPVRGLWEVAFLFEILEDHGYTGHVEDKEISAHFTLKGKPISPVSLKTTRSSEKYKRPTEKANMQYRMKRPL
jgi:hypothetical protein